MGTNYYAHYNHCDCCGRHDEVHIGKSYRTLRAYPAEGPIGQISSWSDWKQWLHTINPLIVDEYGSPIDLEKFIDQWVPKPGMADLVAADNATWYKQFFTILDDYVDADGFRFCTRDFS